MSRPKPPKIGMVPEDPKRGGWAWGRFRESTTNSEIVVKDSTLSDGVDAVWVFTYPDDERIHPAFGMEPHLTCDDAKKLVEALQKFIDHCEGRPRRPR